MIDKSAMEGAPHGVVVIAETQHAGRGRSGRTWYSPKGGVWLSILIRCQGDQTVVDALPFIGAVAIAKTLIANWRVKAQVRWPNDVVVGGRKIAGVLVESKSRGNKLAYAILGLGINANFRTVEIEPIKESSTSLLNLVGRPVSRERLIAAVLSEVEATYDAVNAVGEGALLEILGRLDWSHGKQVTVKTQDKEFTGLFQDYESLSRARIRTKDGLESVEASTVISVDYKSN